MTPGTDREASLGGLGLLASVLVGVGFFLNVGSYDLAIGLILAVVMMVASLPLFRHLADADDNPRLVWTLLVALVVKFVSSLLRYWMVNVLYGEVGDSNTYGHDGWIFAQAVRSGSIIPRIESIDALTDGTRQVTKLTGYLFTVTGESRFAGFFFFSWLAFWGCLLFARGVKRAFPESDHRRYLYLVLFWPSLLFWPSAIGKDAVMVFCLGLATYGACVVLAPKAKVWGVALFAGGVFGMLQVRNHVALMAVLAVVVATTFAFIGGQKAEQAGGRGRVVRLAGLVVMVLLALTATTQTTRFFSEEAGQSTSTTEALELTVERTQQGGSEFEPIVVTNPAQIPAATVSVLFRPFLWEAHSAGAVIASLEGAGIAVLFLLSWKRLLRWPVSAWRRPILIYGFTYTLMFVVAFSSIGNAGILARQRSQMLPLLFLALAVPKTRWWRGDTTQEDNAEGAVTPTADKASVS